MAAFYQVHHRAEPPTASEVKAAVTLGKYRTHQKGPGDCVVLVMSLLDWRHVGKHTHNMCIFLEYLCHTVKIFPPKCNSILWFKALLFLKPVEGHDGTCPASMRSRGHTERAGAPPSLPLDSSDGLPQRSRSSGHALSLNTSLGMHGEEMT